MSQEIIDTGAAPNDGEGDNLRTAFIKVNNNFTQVWTAGPVGSNVRIQGNTISTLQVNQDLALSPNGSANIRLNNNTIPGANNTWFLGSTTNRWRGLYVGNVDAGNITVNDGLTIPGDAYIGGNLTVVGNTIQIGNITTDTKTIQLANSAATNAAANGSGITVGANDNIATFLYNSGTNSWVTNLQVTYANGQPIGKLPGGSNTQIQFNDGGNFGGDADLTYNKSTNTLALNGTLTALDATVYGQVAGVTGVFSGNVAANYFFGNGSQLTGIQTGAIISNTAPALGNGGIWWNSVDGRAYVKYANAFIDLSPSLVPDPTTYVGNVVFDNLTIENVGNIIPAGNNAYSLGSEAFQWKDLWVSNNTIYINSVPITLGAGNVLTVAGNPVVTESANGTVDLANLAVDNNNIYNSTGLGVVISNFSFIDEAETAYIQIPAGNSASDLSVVQTQGNVRLVANATSWTFNDTGNLTLPTNGSIIVDGGDGVIGPVSDDMVISWDNEEIRLVSVQGSIEMQADNAFRVQTNYDGGTDTYLSRWEFSQDEIVNITGPSSIVAEAGNLNLQGGRDTLSSGNVTVTAVNNGVSVNTWTFDNTGNLTAPGNIITTANVYGDVGLFNDINLNNAGTNRMLYVDGDRNIYDTDFSYDSANSSISGSGNITAGYFIGDGSQLTGLPAGYTDADVATFLASYGSNTISTTGNITAGNFIGTGSNVELVAGSEQWTFDTTGVLTVPGNITGANVVSANTFVSNAFNVVTAGNLSITSQYGLGFTGTILEDNGTLELIGSGAGGVYAGWDSNYGNGLGNIATVSFNEVGGEGILLRTGNRAATEYNWNFDSTGNLTLPTEGYLLVQTGIIGAGASPAPTLSGFSSIATTGSPGNISASGNLIVAGYANITGNITGNTAGYTIGYRDIPQVTFSANATAALTDAGKHFYSTTAGNLALTLPDNSSVAFPTGATLTVVVNAVGNVLVNQGTGVSLYQAGASATGNRVVGAYGLATVMKVAANTWVISGTGVY